MIVMLFKAMSIKF